VDLAAAKQLFDLMRGFWNLCFVEARAVGESAKAIDAFPWHRCIDIAQPAT
jgi:hypothetical protein